MGMGLADGSKCGKKHLLWIKKQLSRSFCDGIGLFKMVFSLRFGYLVTQINPT